MFNRKAVAVFVLAVAPLVVLSDAHANEIDQATKFTFSKPIQIPGQVLPAGTYWFVASPSSLIQIFNSDRSALYATLLTDSAETLEPADKSTVTFAERGSMQPEAIVAWFYPGRMDGHEFRYTKQDQKEITQAKQRTVVVGKAIAQAEQRTVPAGKTIAQAK
jgi:hypothetical protein